MTYITPYDDDYIAKKHEALAKAGWTTVGARRLPKSRHMMNHMARKQVLVQLDDELVAALDELAAAHGVSRSELIRRGAQAVLDSAETLRLEKEHIEGYQRHPQNPAFARAVLQASAELLDPYEEG